jgi:hypothetical protein
MGLDVVFWIEIAIGAGAYVLAALLACRLGEWIGSNAAMRTAFSSALVELELGDSRLNGMFSVHPKSLRPFNYAEKGQTDRPGTGICRGRSREHGQKRVPQELNSCTRVFGIC